jgi:hypothetical protein
MTLLKYNVDRNMEEKKKKEKKKKRLVRVYCKREKKKETRPH